MVSNLKNCELDIDDILSFETASCYGIWEQFDECYYFIPKRGKSFVLERISRCNSLEELNEKVYEKINESIIRVCDSSDFKLFIYDLELSNAKDINDNKLEKVFEYDW